MKKLSRRDFLTRTALLSGSLYPAMYGLGMLQPARAKPLHLPKHAKKAKVAILGGGLAGLTAAYELNKLGYSCTILEARERSGGRCWSIRKGSKNREKGFSEQTANFSEGLYFNAGPSRIPHHHEITLNYCRALGVPLEVYNNINENAYYFSEGNGKLANRPIRIREVRYDLRGHLNELLAKAIDSQALDLPFSTEDGEKLHEFLRAEGALNPQNQYRGSSRRGYRLPPGSRAGEIDPPYAFTELLEAGLLEPDFYNLAEYTYELQMSMFQAVGGMEAIAEALTQHVKPDLKLGAQITEIRNQDEQVSIFYTDASGPQLLEADYAICSLPLPVLSNLKHNFRPDVSRAIDFVPYIATGKIGLQFSRRFWEEDEQIFGGISHTNNALNQIFYPSNDYLSQKGILIGYYNFTERAEEVGQLSPAEREALALRLGRKIHPQYDDSFESSFSVSWQHQPFTLGGWALYSEDSRAQLYKHFLQPDGRVYFAGEHTTYLNAWMAGAFASAQRAVTDLHQRVATSPLQPTYTDH